MATQAKEVFLAPPLSIAGCRLWFDAADSSTITGTSNVTAWRDKTASLTLTGSGPTYSNVNGYPTVTFNGNQLISSRNLPYESVCTSDANFTTFIVQLTTSASGVNGIPFTIFLTDNVRRLAVFSSGGGSGGIFIDGASQASPRLSGITQTLNIPQLFCITRKNITTMTARLNGSQVSSADFPGTTNFISSNSYFIYISSGAGPWTGNMYEILHYNRGISDLEIQQIEGYLSWKWGIQALLPRSHPFFSASPYQTLSVPISRGVPLRMSSSTYFSPTAISGCSMWLDAADTTTLTVSGSNVSSWRDKSGNNNNATQATVANQPTTGTLLNGLNVLDFTGTQPYFSFPTISYTNITVFTIFRNTTLRAYCSPLFIGPFFFFFTDGAGNSLYGTGRLGINGEGVISQAAAGITTTNYLLYSLNLTVGATDIVNFYINGRNAANFNGAASGGRSYYQVGSTDDVGATTGFTAEIIVYNGVLNNSQRQQVEGYLAWKWGLQASLPPTHPNFTIPYVPFPFPTSIPKAAIRVWSPLRVAGSQLWLDAADSNTVLFSSGSNVSRWNDKSGNGNHSFALVSPQPAVTYSSNKLTFSAGIQNGLSNTTLTLQESSYSLFSVFSNTASSNAGFNYPVFTGYGGSAAFGVFDTTGNIYVGPNQAALTTLLPSVSALGSTSFLSLTSSGSYGTIVTFPNTGTLVQQNTANTLTGPSTASSALTGISCVMAGAYLVAAGNSGILGSLLTPNASTGIWYAAVYDTVSIKMVRLSYTQGNPNTISGVAARYGSFSAVPTNANIQGFWDNGTSIDYATTSNANGYGVQSLLWSVSGASGTVTPYVNGSAKTTISAATFPSIGYLLSPGVAGAGFIGSISEIILYNSALSTAQRQQVEGYLAWKWGLRSNLPAGHPYINFPPSP